MARVIAEDPDAGAPAGARHLAFPTVDSLRVERGAWALWEYEDDHMPWRKWADVSEDVRETYRRRAEVVLAAADLEAMPE